MTEPRKVPLIQTPTPLHRLDRLSEGLGIDLWIKRDDLTGFGGGGNKGRKLEYLMADALDQGAEAMVTCGTRQSNFVRQLGAACSVLGIKCAAATMDLPYLEVPPGSHALGAINGNVLLDELLGVDLRVHLDGDWDHLYALAEDLALEYEKAGKRVYRVPIGGSSKLGAFSFYQAAQEVQRQSTTPFDWIIFASSSGSTHVGLTYAFQGTSTKVLGIACDPEPEIVGEFAEIGEGLADMLGVPALPASEFLMDFDFVGQGYAAASPEANPAIYAMAKREGIFLDPVYTGKSFTGLMNLASSAKISGRVLFWHTGGFPSLFAATGLK